MKACKRVQKVHVSKVVLSDYSIFLSVKRMTTVDENLIHNLVFDLTLPATVRKDDAIPETEACFEKYALPIVDEVITRLGSMYDCDIEQISVDLGTVSKEQLPMALKSALEDAIIRHLYVSQGEGTELIQKHGSAQDAGVAGNVNKDGAKTPNEERSVFDERSVSERRSVPDEQSVPKGQSVSDGPSISEGRAVPMEYIASEPTWMSYLFTGIVPWNYDVSDDQLSERVWNGVSALLGQSSQLQAFLSRLSNDFSSVFRFVNLLDYNKLVDVIQAVLHLGASKGNALSVRIAQMDVPQLVDLQSIARSSSDAPLQLDARLDRSTLSLLLYSLLESMGEDDGYGQLDEKATSYKERQEETQGLSWPAIEGSAGLDDERPEVEKLGALDGQHGQENMMDESSVDVTVDSQIENKLVSSSEGTYPDRESSSAVVGSDETETVATPLPEVEQKSATDQVRQKNELPMFDMLQGYEMKMAERKQVLADAPTPQDVHWVVDDAGLILLHPFLPVLFERLGYLDEERKFVGLESQEKAVHLLRWMAGLEAPHRDYQLALEKMLCGLPLAYPVEAFFELSDEEMNEGRQVLESVCQNWPPLKGTSVEGLQQSFMRRTAVVTYEDNTWIVRVEGLTIDILLDDLPWEISLLLLPWKKELIMVEWQRE